MQCLLSQVILRSSMFTAAIMSSHKKRICSACMAVATQRHHDLKCSKLNFPKVLWNSLRAVVVLSAPFARDYADCFVSKCQIMHIHISHLLCLLFVELDFCQRSAVRHSGAPRNVGTFTMEKISIRPFLEMVSLMCLQGPYPIKWYAIKKSAHALKPLFCHRKHDLGKPFALYYKTITAAIQSTSTESMIIRSGLHYFGKEQVCPVLRQLGSCKFDVDQEAILVMLAVALARQCIREGELPGHHEAVMTNEVCIALWAP